MLADPFPPNGGAPVVSGAPVRPAETAAAGAALPLAPEVTAERHEILQPSNTLPINGLDVIYVYRLCEYISQICLSSPQLTNDGGRTRLLVCFH